jgi:hypothetical protein
VLQIPRGNDLAVTPPVRIVALDRARTIITLLVATSSAAYARMRPGSPAPVPVGNLIRLARETESRNGSAL